MEGSRWMDGREEWMDGWMKANACLTWSDVEEQEACVQGTAGAHDGERERYPFL